jgi:hypothetical protein
VITSYGEGFLDSFIWSDSELLSLFSDFFSLDDGIESEELDILFPIETLGEEYSEEVRLIYL